MNRFRYQGVKTREISFPLGGLGTGCIGLAGDGRLVDWEIFNRPDKGSANGFSHFAIKAEAGGEVLDARVLHGDLQPPYVGQLTGGSYSGFGFGPRREHLAGLPHFREVEFRGEYPMAALTFKERKFPGRVTMTAFNPLIPLNDKDSGLPAAFFEIEVKNTTKRRLTYTICGTLRNPLPAHNVNRVRRRGDLTALHLTSEGLSSDDPAHGDMTLATDAADVSHQQYWFVSPSLWFSDLEVYWRDFTSPGPLRNRRYTPARAGRGTHATIAARCQVPPGGTATIRFVISWSFPNCENYWDSAAPDRARKAGVPVRWRNYYATLFPDSLATAAYALKNWPRLRRDTLAFKDALFQSDLPPAALDAVSANLAILKSPTVLRLEDGTFYGWEGCHSGAGCCEGSCTHVWNYAQALAFLFPKLERSLRDADFEYNQSPQGGMSFRMQLPLGSGRSSFRPCADGQFGGVMKTYRDWKVCGDTEWLRALWPAVRKSIEFAWSDRNEDRWDPGKTGVLHGRQHHTLDMELFGPNSWLTGLYLGALKAGAEMAEHLGEAAAAQEYRRLFARGKAWVEDHLFNGDYYHQLIDLTDRSIPRRFGASDAYWDEEHGEIRHQIGEGCSIDQVVAQWHADLYGLGEIFDPRRTARALRAIYRHNFKPSMRDFPNPCRVYCLNDEAGLIICDWPAGKRQPVTPAPYSSETMNGFEYAAAAHMIQAGLVEQGMRIVEALRARYDGEKRNPWNEFECGSNYARSLASYALLNAFSGFSFDLVRGLVGFDPVRLDGGGFRCFWSLDSGWGMFRMQSAAATLEVLRGSLEIRALDLPFLGGRRLREVRVGRRKLQFSSQQGRIEFARPVQIAAGSSLTLRWSTAKLR